MKSLLRASKWESLLVGSTIGSDISGGVEFRYLMRCGVGEKETFHQ